MAPSNCYYANSTEATAFAKSLLVKHGLPDEHSELMAKCSVQADTRGVQYVERVDNGLINAKPKLEITEKTPVVAHLDGDNSFGFVVVCKGMDDAIKRAQTYGIGMVTVNHSNHFGMAAIYVNRATSRHGGDGSLGPRWSLIDPTHERSHF